MLGLTQEALERQRNVNGSLSFNTPEYAAAIDMKNTADNSFNLRNLPIGGNFAQSVLNSATGVWGNIADYAGNPDGIGDYLNKYTTAQEMAMGEKPKADFSWDYFLNGLPRDTGNLVGSMAGLAVPAAVGAAAGPVGVIAGGLAGAGLESMAEGGGKLRESLENGDDLATAQDKARTVAGENAALLVPSNLLGLGIGKKMLSGIKNAYKGAGAVEGAVGAGATQQALNAAKSKTAMEYLKGAGLAGAEAANESFQEVLQQGIQDSVDNKDWGILPQNWNEEQQEAFKSTIGPMALISALGGGARAGARKLGYGQKPPVLEQENNQNYNSNLFGAGTADMSTQGTDIDEQVAGLKNGWQNVIPQIGGVIKNQFGIDGAQISSGFRTREHNAEVGGAEHSYHVGDGQHGDALDVVLPDSTTPEQAEAIRAEFENSGAFKEVLFHDSGSGYHLHLGGLNVDDMTNSGSYSGNADIDSMINEVANQYGIDPALLAAVADQESGFNQDANSGAGAIGMMQLMPDTAQGLGVDPNDLRGNLEGGAKYLRQMLDAYNGDTEKALAAYNAGPGSLDSVNGDISQLSDETKNYVPSVLEKYKKYKGRSVRNTIGGNGSILNWDSIDDDYKAMDFFPKNGEESQGTANEFLENLAKLGESERQEDVETAQKAMDALEQYSNDDAKLTKAAEELGYKQTVDPADVHSRVPIKPIVKRALENGEVTFATQKAADIFASTAVGQTMQRDGKTFKVTDSFSNNDTVKGIQQETGTAPYSPYTGTATVTSNGQNGISVDSASANAIANGQSRTTNNGGSSPLTNEDIGRLTAIMPSLPTQVQKQIHQAMANGDVETVRNILDGMTAERPLNTNTNDVNEAITTAQALSNIPEALADRDGMGAVKLNALQQMIRNGDIDGLNRINKYMADNLRRQSIDPVAALNKKGQNLPAVQGERMPSTNVEETVPTVEGEVEDVITPEAPYSENQIEAPAVESDHIGSDEFKEKLNPVERGFIDYLDKVFENVQMGFDDVLDYLKARRDDIFNKRMETVIQQGVEKFAKGFRASGGRIMINEMPSQEVQNAWQQLLAMRTNFGATLANAPTEIQNEYMRVEQIVKDYLNSIITEQCQNNESWRKLNYAVTGLETIAKKSRAYERSLQEEGKRSGTKGYRDVSAKTREAVENSAAVWADVLHKNGTTDSRIDAFLKTIGNSFTRNNHATTLRGKAQYNGKAMNKAGRIEAFIQDGGRAEDRGGRYFVVDPNGNEIQVTRGEYNYYKWLRKNGFSQQKKAESAKKNNTPRNDTTLLTEGNSRNSEHSDGEAGAEQESTARQPENQGNKKATAEDEREKGTALTPEENISNGLRAINSIIKKHEDVHGAMNVEGIGLIDLIWGVPGRGSKFKHGFGISHIIAKRDSDYQNGDSSIDGMATVKKLIEVIAKGSNREIQGSENGEGLSRMKIHHDGYTAILSKGKSGNTWLLTGWEDNQNIGKKNKAPVNAVGEGYDSTNATADTPTLTRRTGETDASIPSVAEKGTESNENSNNPQTEIEDTEKTSRKDDGYYGYMSDKSDKEQANIEDLLSKPIKKDSIFGNVTRKERLELAYASGMYKVVNNGNAMYLTYATDGRNYSGKITKTEAEYYNYLKDEVRRAEAANKFTDEEIDRVINNSNKARQAAQAKPIVGMIKKAGIKVVTDAAKIKEVLGDSLKNAYEDSRIQKLIISYKEGEKAPDLTLVKRTINGKDMWGVAFVGEKPKNYIPKKIGKAYKLMEMWPDGSLHALFAGTDKAYKIGEWNWAQGFTPDEAGGIKSMKLAPRYGWHMGTGVPATHHLMGVAGADGKGSTLNPKIGYPSKSGVGHPKGSKRVWVEVHYDATNDYSDIAEKNPGAEKDIRGLIPFGGYYMFQESNLSNWIIASSIKFDHVLSENERQDILSKAGYDEELMWRTYIVSKMLNKQMNPLKAAVATGWKCKNAGKASKAEKEKAKEIMSGPDAPPKYAGWIPVSKLSEKELEKSKKQLKKYQAVYDDNQRAIDAKTGGKDFGFKTLTAEEAAAERKRIREAVYDNPEWKANEEALQEGDGTQYFTTEDGEVMGFVKDGVVYLDPKHMNANTPIHEYTHVWDNVIREVNPELWEQGKELMKQSPVWDEVVNNPAYADIAQDEDLVASEVHARLTGEKGEVLVDDLDIAGNGKGLAARLKAWAKEYWQTLKDHFTKWGADEAGKVTLDEFISMPLADLANGINLAKVEKGKPRQENSNDNSKNLPKQVEDVALKVFDSLTSEGKEAYELAKEKLRTVGFNENTTNDKNYLNALATMLAFRAQVFANVIQTVYGDKEYTARDYISKLDLRSEKIRINARGYSAISRSHAEKEFLLNSAYIVLGKQNSTQQSVGVLIHELGHAILKELHNAALNENCPEQLRKDFQTIVKWISTTKKPRTSLVTEDRRHGGYKTDPYVNEEKFAQGLVNYFNNTNRETVPKEVASAFSRIAEAIVDHIRRCVDWLNRAMLGGNKNDISLAQKYSIPEIPDDIAEAIDRIFTGYGARPQAKEINPKSQAKVIASNGNEYNVHYEVRPESELVASNTANGSINENYPEELQPRNRKRMGNMTQVNKIAGHLKPSLLTANTMLNLGAPLVRRDGVVLNGNGRVMAIRTALKNGTDNNYKDYLIKHAEEFGLDPADIENMENPVLVKVLDDKLTAEDIDSIINDTSGGQRMSASEQAKADAKKIKSSTLGLYRPNASGELLGKNTDFLATLLGEILPGDELNAYYGENGGITKDGVLRAQRALFALAYGDDHLIDTFAESTNEQAKNFINALNANAPYIAKLQRIIESGHAYNLKLRDSLVTAINELRETILSGKPAERIWREGSVFEEAELSPEVKTMAKIMNDFRKSSKKLTNFIGSIVESGFRHGDPNQMSMFGGVEHSLMEDINRAKEIVENGGQSGLFEDLTENPANKHSADYLKENGNANTELDKLPKVAMDKLRKSEQKLAKFGAAIGVNVHFVESSDKGNRGVFTHNGEIYINRKAAVPVKSIFVHEFIHWLKASPENAGAYDVLHACLENLDGVVNKERIEKYRKRIFDGENMTDEEIAEEIICDAMSNSEAAGKLMRAVNNIDASLAAKVGSYLKAMWDKFCKAIGFQPNKLSRDQTLPNELSVSEMQKANAAFNKILMGLKDENGKHVFKRVGAELFMTENNSKASESYAINPIGYTYTAANFKENESKSKRNSNDVTDKHSQQGAFSNAGNHKQEQFDILQKHNPMTDDYHVGIRSVGDILTAEEAFSETDPDEAFLYPDFTEEDAQEALSRGKVTVYSSYPIKQGVFVSPSQSMAGDYAGGGKIYSKEVSLNDVAWINDSEGMMAKTNTGSNSVKRSRSRNAGISPSTNGVAIAQNANNNLLASMKGIVNRLNPLHHDELDNLRIDRKDDKEDFSLVEYTFTSAARLAKKYKAVEPFFNIAKQAVTKQEQLRYYFNSKMNEIDETLGWGKLKNDPKFKERKEQLQKILFDGDVEGREYTNTELAQSGYEPEVIKAYRQMRSLLDYAWKIANDTKSRIKYHSLACRSSAIADAEFTDIQKKNPFAEMISKIKNADGTVTLNYKEPHIYHVAARNMTTAELNTLKQDKDVYIQSVKQGAVQGNVVVTYDQRNAGLNKRGGYVPHVFHGWYVCKVDKDGKPILDASGNVATDSIMVTADSMSEAVKLGEKLAKQDKDSNYVVTPQTFSAPGAQEQAIVMGDYDYAKVISKVANSMTMSLADARAMMDGTVKMKNRGRFYGYAMGRKGFSGYEQNVYLATMKYFNQTARYVALDPFKRNAISMYNRNFGNFDDANVASRSATAKWIKKYISDMNGTPTFVEKMLNTFLHGLGVGKERAGGRPALWLQQNVFTYPMTIMKLGILNPASAILNLTQLFNLYGALGEKVMSGEAYRRLLENGFRDTFKAMSDKNSALGKLLWEDLGLNYQIGMDISAGYSNAEVTGLGSLHGFTARMAGKSMYFFRQSDAFARGVTLLTAYNKALSEGKSKAEAIEYAKVINDKVNFDYSVADEPWIFRAFGPISKVLLQFKKYPVKQIELFHDFYLDGRDAGLNKKQSAMRMLKYMAPYMAMSGVSGIPFISLAGGLFSALVATVSGDDDWDWEKKMKQYMIAEFGQDSPLTQWWLYGGGAMLGINVGSRIGVGDFMGSDSYNSADGVGGLLWNQTTLGSTINQVSKQMSYRNYAEAVKAINPTVGNILQAYKGEVRTTRGRMKYEYQNLAERIWRGIGFTPLNEAMAGDLSSFEYAEMQEQTKGKERAVDDFLVAPSEENAKRLNEYGVTPKTIQTEAARRTMNRHELNQLEKEKTAKKAKSNKTEKKYSANDYLKKLNEK